MAADVVLRLAPSGTPQAETTNPMVLGLLGKLGISVLLRGFSGNRVDPLTHALTANSYLIDAQGAGGLHAAFPLSATAAGASPTPANSAVLIRDEGIYIGDGKALRMYDTAGTDYAQLSGDADGGLVLGGSGASAKLFSGLTALALGATPATIGAVRLTNNTGEYWRNAGNTADVLGLGVDGANNVLVGDGTNAASATLQALTVYLRVGATDRLIANATSITLVDPLLFSTDNTQDIGAAGATRPRDLFLGRDATIGGIVTVTGGQVVFPATQAPSAGANTLDDYEEGTWTPNVGGSATYTIQTGNYIKVGRKVTVWGDLQINAIGTGSTTTISGLPFAADIAVAGVVSVWISLATAVTALYVEAVAATSTMLLRGLTAAAVTSSTIAGFGAGTFVRFALTYRTAN